MRFGYHGRYLRVDLSAGRSTAVEIPESVCRQFIGGSGLGAWLLLQETAPNQDALAPEAPLGFVFSPLVGSPLTTSAKFAVMAKSPLTERINDSLSSSHFAIAGKKTGYDAIVVVGAADRPTCLVVEPSGIRFVDATTAWGRTVSESSEILLGTLGPGFRMATIGPAGEQLVRYATVSHDGRHAGRGGLGAVMGSKRLKAVAVRGDCRTAYADPDQLIRYSRDLSARSMGEATAKYRELGTVSNLLTFNRLGTLPTRNFQQGAFEGAEAISPASLAGDQVRTRTSCAACTIGCEHLFARPSGKPVRMEYENLFALGPLCGISDAQAVLEASALCDELGLDTISAGGTMAFAMECAERGLLQAPELRFGHAEGLLQTLRAISSREGIGDLLALGSRAAARVIGGGSESFAPHVKGLEMPGYEPRALQTMALGFAVGTRGADHNRSGAYQVDFSDQVDRMSPGLAAVPMAIRTENLATAMDSLILCKFVRGVFDEPFESMAEMLRMITGWEFSAEELNEAANRIVSAKKRYNILQGWTPAEDTLPDRFFETPLAGGASSGALLSRDRLNEMIAAYNRQRGWTPEGWLPDFDDVPRFPAATVYKDPA